MGQKAFAIRDELQSNVTTRECSPIGSTKALARKPSGVANVCQRAASFASHFQRYVRELVCHWRVSA